MFVTYLADYNETWQHEKYRGVKDDPDAALDQVGFWIEQQTFNALRHGRRVWVYRPYWNETDAARIFGAIKEIQAKLVILARTDKTGFGNRFNNLLRLFEKPIQHGLEKVDKTHCVVYYVEPSKDLSERL